MEKNVKSEFLVKLIENLAPSQADVRDWVKQTKKENPSLNKDELAEYIADTIVWTYTRQGAYLALPGAIPGLGTFVQAAVEAGALSADIALLVRNQTYLISALSECYGKQGRKVLVQDALICMGLWTNALSLTKSGAVRIGNKVAGVAFKKFPAEILKKINKKVGTTILTKYGTKRGGIALGKLIPFGVGMLVGGGFNYITMKKFASSSRNYLSLKAGK